MNHRAEKERSEIPEPLPVTVAGVRYEAVPWGRARGLEQNGGYIAAFEAASGRELWLLKVYDVICDERKEGDKQTPFIEDLMIEPGGLLRVTDERGGLYRIDVNKRAVVGD